MKTLIAGMALLGFGAGLLAHNPSAANETLNTKKIAQAATSEEFVARGTEPFWSMTVSKRGIIYSSPEVKKRTFAYVKPLSAAARPADLVRVYLLRGQGNNTLIIKKVDACSDGMSDINYPYSATLILGSKVLEGCAEKK